MRSTPAWLVSCTAVTMRGGGHRAGARGRGRGRGRGGRGRPARGGGYRGSGVPFTPVAKGFKYFKYSFVEDPWRKLREKEQQVKNDEEIELTVEDNGDQDASNEQAAAVPT